MKRFVFVVLLVSLILSGCGADQAAGPTLTPSPLPGSSLATSTALPAMSISTIILGENPHPAGGLPVTLRVKSSIDTSEVRVTITLPAEVIMLTGHGSVESGIQGLQLGAYNYVMKPVPLDDLLKQMTQAYERKLIEEERSRKAGSEAAPERV